MSGEISVVIVSLEKGILFNISVADLWGSLLILLE